jgi:hypothetical protein
VLIFFELSFAEIVFFVLALIVVLVVFFIRSGIRRPEVEVQRQFPDLDPAVFLPDGDSTRAGLSWGSPAG